MRTVIRSLWVWLRRCVRYCVIGLSATSYTVSPHLADPWADNPRIADPRIANPWPPSAPPPRLPPGHPERIPDLPLSAVESELWSQLTG